MVGLNVPTSPKNGETRGTPIVVGFSTSKGNTFPTHFLTIFPNFGSPNTSNRGIQRRLRNAKPANLLSVGSAPRCRDRLKTGHKECRGRECDSAATVARHCFRLGRRDQQCGKANCRSR